MVFQLLRSVALGLLFDRRSLGMHCLDYTGAIVSLIRPNQIFSPSNIAWLLLSWFGLKLIHETAHAALRANRQGGEVHDLGLVFILFAPMAYVDVTSCWRMNSKWSRIAVAGAGMYAEVVVASVAMIVWTFVDAPHYSFLLQNIILTASAATILFNANVLMRFDGYYMLADAIEVSNLYSESTTAVKRLVKRALTGQHDQPSGLIGWRRSFVLVYGAAALVWKVFICVTLAIAASSLMAGAGVLIAATGIAIWCGPPARKTIQFFHELWISNRPIFYRAAATSLVAITTLFAGTVWAPFPSSVTVAAVTEYLPETTVRSRADGFVRRVHVHNLQAVEKGDLLVELENPQLLDRLRQLEIQQQQNLIRQRQANGAHDAAAMIVLKENYHAFQKQSEELAEQCKGLRVLAHRSGRVIARDLSIRQGAYVQEGDHLMNIADETEKELVAVVDPSFVRKARQCIGQNVTLCSASYETFPGIVERIDPRATAELPHRSLAATAGGPLTVRERGEEGESSSLELLEPHFLARVSVEPSIAKEVPAGMRMQAKLGYRSESLLIRLRSAIIEIIDQANSDH